ncbi:MAG: hypothetical protein FJ148_23570 [Deltaproteobacteria bacterium]|nr:hypothetical protein [Deltaproteobacteria bacterium]
MSPRNRFTMQCVVGFLSTVGLLLPASAPSADVVTTSGVVTWVSSEVVEVGGRRGLIVPGTSITSDGREVSIGSVTVGMPAELEIGSDGRALELRVKGLVE